MNHRAVFPLTTGDLATRLGATLRGPSDRVIERLDTLDGADERALTFIRDARNAARWATSRAGAALLSRSLTTDPAINPPDVPGRTLLVVDDADHALISLLELLAPRIERPAPGVSPQAAVHPSASVAADASVGPFCTIGPGVVIGPGCILHSGVWIGAGVRIGAGCELHSAVCLYPGTSVGSRCIIHANAVIGADGFGYRPSADGRGVVKIPHVGTVEIHDDVEIGAGTTIDRAKFGATLIGAGTKIDNLVQIAHNCRVGRCCIICGCTALAGSVTLGDGVTLAGGVGVADNVTIGPRARVGAKSGVMNDIPAGEDWLGIPAVPARQALRTYVAVSQLPDVLSQFKSQFKKP